MSGMGSGAYVAAWRAGDDCSWIYKATVDDALACLDVHGSGEVGIWPAPGPTAASDTATA